MLDLENRRLDAARRMIRHVADHLQADLSVELWNGEVIPLGATASGDIRLVLRSSRTIRRLLLSPKLMTLFELYATGDLDVAGGSPLEATDRWDHIKALKLSKTLDRRLMLSLAWPFLAGRGGGSQTDAGYDAAVTAKLDAGRNDKDLIQFHYDVSNEFYELFLDPEMVYSCGYFETPETSLEHAQLTKLDRICRKLRLAPGERLLDIGCGWGGLVCHAAEKYGVYAHGVTLSQAQHDFASAKIARLGLSDRVTVELSDYRALKPPKGGYDKIAQIEMFEHVGIDNHDAHFDSMRRLLRPRGLYLHQATTRMATKELARFRKPTPYSSVITRFIFPGGELDYIGLTATNLERHGFEVHDVEAMREHFALTLRHWAQRLEAHKATADALIGPQRTRVWRLYFALFARGFERNSVSVFQTLASRRQTGASGLGFTRTV
jgi:cyclopropane-fatty-acyl-phospholipid synthase